MTVYVFSGRVVPERAEVELKSEPFVPFPIDLEVDSESLIGKIRVKVSLNVSQLAVIVETRQEVPEIETLKNLIEQVVRAAVDTYGYLTGRGYDVEITSVVRPDGQLSLVFGVGILELEKTGPERDRSFNDLFELEMESPQLRQALADLREAIRSPLDTGFFCFRAIECLRQAFVDATDGDNRDPSWERLREALRVDRAWFKSVETFAVPARHGRFHSVSSQQRIEMMKRTRNVVARFVEYARIGFQPLPDAQYPLLR